jgi:replicative superfamily II helicase
MKDKYFVRKDSEGNWVVVERNKGIGKTFCFCNWKQDAEKTAKALNILELAGGS